MNKYKSDIEIARRAKMKPINKVLAKIKVPDKSSAFSPMGRHIAKINFEFLDKLKKKKRWQINFSYCNYTYAGWGRKNYHFCWLK